MEDPNEVNVQKEKEKGNKRRAKSPDVVAALEPRIAKLELFAGDKTDELEDVCARLESLEGKYESLTGMLQAALNEPLDSLRQEITGHLESISVQFEEMKTKFDAIEGEWAVLKKAMAHDGVTTSVPHKVKTPEPKTYGGSRNAKELDNFLFHMERYLDAISLTDDKAKIRTATMYLVDDAMLWWRRRYADIERGTCSIDTWEDFQKELLKQFYPENAEHLARRSLKRLKQTGSIRDYVKEFSSLMLEIPDMPEKELLFNFMDGLQQWAEQELRRRGVQDLASAMAAAEQLVEFNKGDSSKHKSSKGNHGKGGGEKGGRKVGFDWLLCVQSLTVATDLLVVNE